MRWGAALALVTLVGVASCSLEELSREYGVTDAGPSPPPGLLADAGADGATGFCASRASRGLVCDDFDEGLGFSQWPEVVQVNGGTLAIDREGALSSPASLLVTVPDATKDSPIAYLERRLSTDTSAATLSFAIQTDDVTGRTERAPSCAVRAYTTKGMRELRLTLAAPPRLDEIHLDATNQVTLGKQLVLAEPLRPGVWTRMEMRVSFVGAGHVTVTVGGKTAVDQDLSGGWGPAPASALVGIAYAVPPTKAFRLRLDDVLFEAR